jgi:excisionase family DNA binding protein
MSSENARKILVAPADILAWTLPEAARRIGTSRRFLEKQIAAGHLRAVKLSARCVRIRPGDLAAWMERRAV